MFKFDHSQTFVFDSFCSVVSNCPITQAHFLAESACNAGVAGHTSLIPGLGRFPWRRKWQSTPAFLLGKSHGQNSLVGHSLWGHKESDRTEGLNMSGDSYVSAE